MIIRGFLKAVLFTNAVVVFMSAYAQQHGEIRMGLGYASSYFIARHHEDGGGILNWDDSQVSIPRKELVKYFDYNFRFGKRLSAGVAASYNNFVLLIHYPYKDEKIRKQYKQATLTVFVRHRYTRDSSKLCQFYGSMNLGLSIKETETKHYLSNDGTYLKNSAENSGRALHLNFIGVSIGKKIGGYAELGLGFKGLINAGIYFRP